MRNTLKGTASCVLNTGNKNSVTPEAKPLYATNFCLWQTRQMFQKFGRSGITFTQDSTKANIRWKLYNILYFHLVWVGYYIQVFKVRSLYSILTWLYFYIIIIYILCIFCTLYFIVFTCKQVASIINEHFKWPYIIRIIRLPHWTDLEFKHFNQATFLWWPQKILILLIIPIKTIKLHIVSNSLHY